jgi:signal transduction histidine kinase
VRQEDAGVTVRVEDDGRGFDAALPTAGLGLTGMRERAALMGGELELTSSAAGTVVSARFPL